MKKSLLLLAVICITSILFVSCKKQETPVIQDDAAGQSATVLTNKCAKYRVSVFKDQEMKKWLATLNKGEMVSVLEEITLPKENDKEILISKIKLSDDTEGFIKSDYLALKAVVINMDNVNAYERNNTTSKSKAVLPKGYIAMVDSEKANWIQISGSPLEDKKNVWKLWIQEGFSEDPELIQDAVMLESAREVFSGVKEGDKEEAKKQIELLSKKANIIAEAAQKLLEATPIDATGETSENPENKEQPVQ